MGSPSTGIGMGSYIIFSSGLTGLGEIDSPDCANTSNSALANLSPKHILSPPPNGTSYAEHVPIPRILIRQDVKLTRASWKESDSGAVILMTFEMTFQESLILRKSPRRSSSLPSMPQFPFARKWKCYVRTWTPSSSPTVRHRFTNTESSFDGISRFLRPVKVCAGALRGG
ncbi:hypothetical protein NL676_031551 [Syzygium grande]|nr:hypothetical protein NL676_031551 [Syzygium grande]